MKKLFKNILINFFCLFLIAKILGAITYKDNLVILFWAATYLTIFNFLVKPILNLLLMPVNLLTLGAFRWITNVVVLFLVTIFVSGFKVLGFTFPGFSSGGLVVPPINLPLFWSLVLVSFLIEALSHTFDWIFKQ